MRCVSSLAPYRDLNVVYVEKLCVTDRSVPKQIEYWARIGKAVLENPELPLHLIQDTMLSAEEAKAGQLTPYKFG